jgi:CubicO group peptidase (beta-lactamase class C family)
MKTIEHQLGDLAPQINQILKHSGAPGLSLGVLHKGKVIHTAHFGRRDARNPTPPDDDTIHWIGSLTKLITASAIARLVHEGKLAWDVPIREYLPAFRTRQDEFGLKATLVDLLSNRPGLSMSNTLVHFQNGEAPLAGTDTTATATYLSSTKPFGQFVYSQWSYALVENVVKEVTGISLCDYIEANIFRSLGMTRSSFDSPLDSDDNVALAHCTHDDGTATPKPDYKRTLREAGIAAGGGARTSTKGYLTFLRIQSSYQPQRRRNARLNLHEYTSYIHTSRRLRTSPTPRPRKASLLHGHIPHHPPRASQLRQPKLLLGSRRKAPSAIRPYTCRHGNFLPCWHQSKLSGSYVPRAVDAERRCCVYELAGAHGSGGLRGAACIIGHSGREA